MKKTISIVLSVSIVFSMLLFCNNANAQSYEETLKNKGFADSYIDSLVELHKKYPNWEFVAFNTGLDWSQAVAGERSKHKNQIIEKDSSYGNVYYCSCSECKVNGTYKYQYSGCYSASQWAVEYFMDPRNWLDEKHIFQFHTHAYSESETQKGVEAILKPTWMHNAYITYKNTEGVNTIYKNSSGSAVKYSASIMSAAKNSGLSAYYLASRIVKEVGSTKPTATGVSGTKLPFNGMFNYYSIGASSGGTSGLEFASGYLRTNSATTMYSSYNTSTKKAEGTKTSLPAKQYMSFIGEYGNYYKVRLYSQSGYTSGAVGYVLKSVLRTTYFNYSRPWTNPDKAISGGASYIANGYLKYQYTGYLEKFNVNSASGQLYSHEYMQNVDAVSIEAVSSYNAYKEAGLLSDKHIFYIPIFYNMPADTSTNRLKVPAPSGVRYVSKTAGSIKIKWNEVAGATKYTVVAKNLSNNKKTTKTVTTSFVKFKKLKPGVKYELKVRAHINDRKSAYSSAVKIKTVPMRAKITSVVSKKKGRIYTSWNKVSGASGYELSYAKDKRFKKKIATKQLSKKTLNYTGKGFTNRKKYYVRVRAYTKKNGKRYYGKWSVIHQVKMK